MTYSRIHIRIDSNVKNLIPVTANVSKWVAEAIKEKSARDTRPAEVVK